MIGEETDRDLGALSSRQSGAKSWVASQELADRLNALTASGKLEITEGDKIRCVACGHRCLIARGRRGICKVRYNADGQLRVPFGYVAALQCDPVEKKPFFHVHPGSDALTFGMMGCDFHCGYCQNWVTSQALRDPASLAPVREMPADQLVEAAEMTGARLVVSSYNEPLITAEWSAAVFEKARQRGLLCAFVSNGNATPEALDFLQPHLTAYKVDLKTFDDRKYRSLGGTLRHVTRAIEMIHARGIWLEVLTLVVPGFNDSQEELRSIARFIAAIDRSIPWHVTAFHQDYKMTSPAATRPDKLMRAAEIGANEGLRFVYAGNLPGQVGDWEHTRCPGCRKLVIKRFGYLVEEYRLTPEGTCPDCLEPLPGVWPARGAEAVPTGGGWPAYYRRLPKVLRI